MLDIISIIILLIAFIFIGVIGILIVIGGNMFKTDIERQYEDEEQIKFLREYNENHKRNKWYCKSHFLAFIWKEVLKIWREKNIE